MQNISVLRGILGIIIVILFFQRFHEGLRFPGIDYYQFWVGGAAIREGQKPDLYSSSGRDAIGAIFRERAKTSGSKTQALVSEHRATLHTYGTPFLYSVFSIFVTGNYDFDAGLFLFASLCFYLFGLGLLSIAAEIDLTSALVLMIF